MLRALDIPYLALNPGASYRGLHDSIVNYLGNEQPQMLLCLHEESAVAIAHGYAKASGRMMGVVLHSNVGLMHGTMAIFNAWCDRVPMLILGATGPVGCGEAPAVDRLDPHRRPTRARWCATTRSGTTSRRSVPAAYEALLRAAQIAHTAPRGPTYVNLDAALQEVEDRRAAAAARRRRASRAPAPVFPAQRSRCRRRRSCSPARRTPPSSPDASAAAKRLEGARRARREAAGAGVHRHQDAGRIPDRSSAARRAAGDVPGRASDAARVPTSSSRSTGSTPPAR